MNDKKPNPTNQVMAPSAAAPFMISRREMLRNTGFWTASTIFMLAELRDHAWSAPAQGKGAGGPRRQPLAATQNDNPQLPLWGDGARWDRPGYYDTILAGRRMSPKTWHNADIDGDGLDELIGRGPGGILVNHFDPSTGQWIVMRVPRAADGGSLWRDDYGWNFPQYYETINCGDIDGDGKAELIGRGGQGIEIYQYDNKSGLIPKWIPFPSPEDFNTGGTLWSDTANWFRPQYYQTIQCADINRDGVAELIGRGPNGIEIYEFKEGVATPMPVPDFGGPIWSDVAGWDKPEYYQTIQCADIDGDNQAELIGRGVNGIEVYKYDPISKTWNHFVAPNPSITNRTIWSDSAGWNLPQYYLTIQSADIDGDGRAELIGRGADGIAIFHLAGQTWMGNLAFPESLSWDDPNGWNQVQYYATIQTARALKPGDVGYTGDGKHVQSVLLGRGSFGMQTWAYNATLKKAEQTSTPVTAVPPLNDLQQKAFVGLDLVLRQNGATGNIRDAYSDTTADFKGWQDQMYIGPPSYDTPVSGRPPTNLPLPAGVDKEAWEAVTWQIYWETVWVVHVQDWFGNKIGTLLDKASLGKTLTLQDIGDKLGIPADSTASLVFNLFGLAAAAVAVAFASIAAPPAAAAAAGFIGAIFRQVASSLPGGGSAFQIEYNKLQDLLVNSFTQAGLENDQFQLRILGSANAPADFGLLKAIGQMIKDTTWAWTVTLTDTALDGMLRSYAISIWQTLLATRQWSIWSTNPEQGPPSDYPADYILRGNGGDGWWLTNGLNSWDYPPTETLKALFDPHSLGKVFPLGVPKADVFACSNGWPNLPFSCLNPSCDQPPGYTPQATGFTSEPMLLPFLVLSRDENTREILATVTVSNRGLTPATNVEITKALLNGRRALQTSVPTRIHQGNPQQILLLFPNLPRTRDAILGAVLQMSGRYLGGTFNASFRASLPD